MSWAIPGDLSEKVPTEASEPRDLDARRKRTKAASGCVRLCVFLSAVAAGLLYWRGGGTSVDVWALVVSRVSYGDVMRVVCDDHVE